MTNNDKLRAAAQAVIDRWETPKWKDAPATAEYIAALRDALAAERTDAGQEPVLSVTVEPDYWSGGHFHQGSKPHINPFEVYKLAVGTKLYAAPQPAVAAGWMDAQQIHMAWRGALKACGVSEADRDVISAVVLSMLAESSAPPAPSTEGESRDRLAPT